jgi:hypothetical protein
MATKVAMVDGRTKHSNMLKKTVSQVRVPIHIEESTKNVSSLPQWFIIRVTMMFQPTLMPNWKLLLKNNQFQLVLKLTKQSSNRTEGVSFQVVAALILIMPSFLLGSALMVIKTIGKSRILGALAGVNKGTSDS